MPIDLQELIISKLEELARMQVKIDSTQQTLVALDKKIDGVLARIAETQIEQTEILHRLEHNMEDHKRIFERIEEVETDLDKDTDEINKTLESVKTRLANIETNCQKAHQPMMNAKLDNIEKRLEAIERLEKILTSKWMTSGYIVIVASLLLVILEHLTGLRIIETVIKVVM